MNKIEKLAECALSASNKEEAKKYIQQMRFATDDVWGASKNIWSEMIAVIDNAAGRVSDKARKESIANQLIIKAQMSCVEKN